MYATPEISRRKLLLMVREICESFLPRKFPTIRYAVCHALNFAPGEHEHCIITASGSLCIQDLLRLT